MKKHGKKKTYLGLRPCFPGPSNNFFDIRRVWKRGKEYLVDSHGYSPQVSAVFDGREGYRLRLVDMLRALDAPEMFGQGLDGSWTRRKR